MNQQDVDQINERLKAEHNRTKILVPFREGVPQKIFKEQGWGGPRDPQVGYVAIEVEFTEPLGGSFSEDEIQAVVDVTPFGIVTADMDGSYKEPLWRPHLIPWHRIRSITLHQVS